MNKTVHKIAKIWQISYWLAIIFFVFGILNIAWMLIRYFFYNDFWAISQIWPHLIFTLFSSIVSLFFFKALLNVHIMTSIDGLEYYGIGLYIRSSWESMEQIKLIGIAPQLGIGTEFITLSKTPEILSISWYRSFLYGRNEGIPLSDFGQWRHTALGNEIKKYAPKLFA